MRRLVLLFSLIVGFHNLVAVSSVWAAVISGTIESVDVNKNQVILNSGNSKPKQTFSVPNESATTIDGKSGKLSDLKNGQRISVFTSSSGVITKLTVRSVEEKRVTRAKADDSKTNDPGNSVKDNMTGQELLTFMGHSGKVASVAFSPDGNRLASGGHDQTVMVWDAVSGEVKLTLKGHSDMVTSVAFSPDGRQVASGSWDQTVKLWDASNGRETLTFKGHTDTTYHPQGIWSVAYSADGKWLASSGCRTISVWDSTSGKESLKLARGTYWVQHAAFSGDGKCLAAADFDGKWIVSVWDATSGQKTHTLNGHTYIVGSVAFSPDGKLLASPSRDNTVKVWDIASGKDVLTLDHFCATIVTFSADGKRLASGSGCSGTLESLKVWDAVSGQATLALKGHTKVADGIRRQSTGINGIAFSPDGKRLASASDDGTVKVWDVTPHP